jgi:hypothetical protein
MKTATATKMKNVRSSLAIASLVMGSCVSAATASDVTVRAVVAPVSLIRDGVRTSIAVKAGMTIADADELLGGSETASVQLECPNGATQTLSGKFDAIVNGRAAKSRCAIDLKAGIAVATALAAAPDKSTDDDASISGGPYAMTSHHTQFGLSVTPGARARTEAFVVDGEALVSAVKARVPKSLQEGQLFSSMTSKVERIPEETFQRIATAYAQLDLTQLSRAVKAQVATALQSQWLAALKQPGNSYARKALVETQTRLGLSSSLVSKYQIARATPIAGAATSLSSQFGASFPNPMQGEYRLDYCLPNNRCGKDTAIAWCQAHGYSGVAKWTAAVDIGDKTPTQRMCGGAVCNRGPCDGFASIICE